MTDNIIQLHRTTNLEVPTEKVLTGALLAKLDVAFVLGRDENGKLLAFSSVGDVGQLLVMMEEFKQTLFSGGYETDPENFRR